jgi:hypothetical protein
MSSRKNERRQRTNIVASALGGSIFGALGGLAFAGWEVAILGWFGAGAPHDMGLVLGVAVFAITGAILGSVSGMSGLSDGNWSLAAAILTCGWLLSGKAAGWVAVLGIPGVLGTMFVVAVAVAAGQLLARMPLPPWVLHGSAVTLVAWMAFCVPLNLHVLPTPVDGLALGVDLFFGFVALFLGAVAAVVSNEKGPPVVAIVAAGALGWGAAWPASSSRGREARWIGRGTGSERPWRPRDTWHPPVCPRCRPPAGWASA